VSTLNVYQSFSGCYSIVILRGGKKVAGRLVVGVVVRIIMLYEADHGYNNNESRENTSELNKIILNNNDSAFSFNALNLPIFSFTRVYLFINSYYHLDPASPSFPIQH
jgi:hypothetical protein